MDLDGIRTNLAAWSSFREKPSKAEKSKNVFLKVHDGKLTYESREALPTGIKWLKSKGEYNFGKNIEQLKTVLTTARDNIDSLKPAELQKLQELHKLYDNLVARYQQKATPGVIGRFLIFLGVKDYKAEINRAVEAQKLPFSADDWSAQSPLKTGTQEQEQVQVRPDLMRSAAISKSEAAQVPSMAAAVSEAAASVTPKTPAEIGQAAVRGILMGSIDAFSKAATSRQVELRPKDPAAADQIAEQLKELAEFRTGITSSNAGEKLEEFHRKFDATKLPEVSTQQAEAEAPEFDESWMAELDGISGANQASSDLPQTVHRAAAQVSAFEGAAGASQGSSNALPAASVEESGIEAFQVKKIRKPEAPKTFSEVYDEIQVLSEKADLLEVIRKGKDLPPHEDLPLLQKDIEKLKQDLENHNGDEFPAEFLERLQIADSLLYVIQLDTYK